MKKVKWTLMSLAVIVSVCGAFVTRPHFDCSNDVQYYFAGGVYTNAGKLGVNYVCDSGSGTCTYYTNDGIHYFTCQNGLYCTGNCLVGGSPKPVKAKNEVPSPEHSGQ